jgi:ribosomal protein S11
MQFKRTILFLNVAFLAIGFAYFGRSNSRLDEAETALRLGQIQAILSQSEIGRSALVQAEQYEVKIQFEAGQGTVYQSFNNTMTIDAAHSPERAALSFVHEMVHARYHHEAIRPVMVAVGRQAYVEARVLEEAEAVALAIEAKMALEAAGVEFGQAHPPLEDHYLGAHEAAKKAAVARERDISQVELAVIGQAAGRERAVQAFANGELLTSHTMETYPDYYGSCWDRTDTLASLITPLREAVSSQAMDDLADWVVERGSDSC